MGKTMSKCLLIIATVLMFCGLCACGGIKEYATVSDYVNSINRSDRSFGRELSEDDVEVRITAEGDVMVYTFRFDDMERSDELAEALEAELAKEDVTFQNVADEIVKFVDVTTGVVEIRYLDCNGELVYSKKYTSAEKND